MPSKIDLVEQVASQMMRCGLPGRIKATIKQKEDFQKQHINHISWVINNLPRCSTGVHAVVTKCMIKYEKERVAEYCKSIRQNIFQGKEDPAFLMWKFLTKHRGYDTIAAYKRAVCSTKAYMEGRRLKTLTAVKGDIFDWDEGWTVPDDLLKNWNPNVLPD